MIYLAILVILITAILSQLIWWQAKSSEGRDWPNKGEQLWNWISR